MFLLTGMLVDVHCSTEQRGKQYVCLLYDDDDNSVVGENDDHGN